MSDLHLGVGIDQRRCAACMAHPTLPCAVHRDRPACSGASDCPSVIHEHGCYADLDGSACNCPEDHDFTSEPNLMTAEHAHALDTGGEVDLAGWLRDWRLTDCEHAHDPSPLSNGLTCCSPCLRDRLLASGLLTTRASAADAVLAEARQLCCGDNPSPHHEATAKHSERMAFAGDLARAVRGL